jgi:hypothetical protein
MISFNLYHERSIFSVCGNGAEKTKRMVGQIPELMKVTFGDKNCVIWRKIVNLLVNCNLTMTVKDYDTVFV